MSNSAYWIIFDVFCSFLRWRLSAHDYFSGLTLQSAGRVTPFSALLLPFISFCSKLSLFLSFWSFITTSVRYSCWHTRMTTNSDCSLKSNTTFQMHVYRTERYIFKSIVVYLCYHCLVNSLCMRGRRVQRRWILRTKYCLQQTGCLVFLLPLLLFLIF